MAFWLVKEEPTHYSYFDLERDGRTSWEGVRNPLALRHLGSMTLGEFVLYYHTGDERACVGIAKVVGVARAAHGTTRITLAPERRLARPVPLAEIKADGRFAESPLVRMGRLSVLPVTAPHWRALLRLADASAPSPYSGTRPSRARRRSAVARSSGAA